MRVRGKNLKSVRWNDEVKTVVRRKEAAWKEVLEASDEVKRKMNVSVQRRKGVYINSKRK